eukprot:11001825-Karenia_brevis.AAC.1
MFQKFGFLRKLQRAYAHPPSCRSCGGSSHAAEKAVQPLRPPRQLRFAAEPEVWLFDAAVA